MYEIHFLTDMQIHDDPLDPKYRRVDITFDPHKPVENARHTFSIPMDCYPDELAAMLRKAADWLDSLV